VPRSQLGNAVAEVGDRQFADIIQPFLYDKLRKITLGRIFIIPPRPKVPTDQPMVHVLPDTTTNMPDWPMPGNIIDFKEIVLRFILLINKLKKNYIQLHILAVRIRPSSISWENFKKIPF
jgi:hypothetical protein